jgi:hypothetical protein
MLVAPPFRISLPEAGHLEALDFALTSEESPIEG